jgi:LysR family transcriptional regulator, glycine cleavage system transcriptional activator
MRRNLPPLLAVRAFDAAARHMSFSLAGEELHVTQSAISRQIKVLEEALGYPLFVRSIRRVTLTPQGVLYQQAAADALDILERASSRSANVKRILTISAPQSLATFWLLPRLSEFAETYPHIDVRVRTSTEPADFERDEIDVAIRLGRMPGVRYDPDQPRVPQALVRSWKGVSAVHLWDEVLVPVLSKKLLRQGPPLKTPADLRNYKLLHVALRPDAWADWFRCNKAAYPKRASTMEFGHFFMALEAAKAGHGVALAPRLFLDGPFGSGGEMACPLPAATKSAGAYYFLCKESMANDRTVRTFLNWLTGNAK